MSLTQGLQLPFGIQPVNPTPVDAWSGPYFADTAEDAVAAANLSIPESIRFQSMEVRLVIAGVSKKYWYRDGISDEDLVEIEFGAANIESITAALSRKFVNEIVFNERVAATDSDVGMFFSLASTPTVAEEVLLWLNGQLLTYGDDYVIEDRLISMLTSPVAPEDRLIASYSRPVAMKQYKFGERLLLDGSSSALQNTPTSGNDVMLFLNGQLLLRGFAEGDNDYVIIGKNISFNIFVENSDIILASYSYS